MKAKDKTTIVIAHRLSTVKSADFVMMLEGGEMVEMGTHDELQAKNGAYARLVEKQMQKGELAEGDGVIK